MNESQKLHKRVKLWHKLGGLGLVFVLFVVGLQSLQAGEEPDFGYGANVAEWDISTLQAMGFNWIKVFSGPGSRLPIKVLLRIDATAGNMGNLNGFGDSVQQLAQQQKGYVDAYEIGNEPNLDASYGWTAPPNAGDYAALLCEAYGRIKAVDPGAVVVSAGLAPTGRVPETWQGHPGHNGRFQDERAFLQEFLDAGGGQCFDVLGYHPYGYSADYDAEPDVYDPNDPTRNCVNGFCFRGAEKIYDILVNNGLGTRQIWATEFGWLVEPPDKCLDTGSWDGRAWQIVSEEKQAGNLVGAYEYATSNWHWMGAMFIFNLNFNTAPWITDECEQMRYYGIKNRPAEAALAAMPKVSPPAVGELSVSPSAYTDIITPSQQPYDQPAPLALQNIGTLPLSYTLTLSTTTPLTATLTGATSGSLEANEQTAVSLQLNLDGQPPGTYTASLNIETESGGLPATETIPLTIYVWEEIHRAFAPLIFKP